MPAVYCWAPKRRTSRPHRADWNVATASSGPFQVVTPAPGGGAGGRGTLAGEAPGAGVTGRAVLAPGDVRGEADGEGEASGDAGADGAGVGSGEVGVAGSGFSSLR